MRYLWLLPVVLLVGCGSPFAGFAGPTPTATLPPGKCAEADRRTAANLLREIDSRWDDAVTLANSTPRMQLANQIAELQRVRRDFEAQVWPACSSKVKDIMVQMMDATITGFTEFLAQRPHEAHFARAEQLAKDAIVAAGDLAP